MFGLKGTQFMVRYFGSGQCNAGIHQSSRNSTYKNQFEIEKTTFTLFITFIFPFGLFENFRYICAISCRIIFHLCRVTF